MPWKSWWWKSAARRRHHSTGTGDRRSRQPDIVASVAVGVREQIADDLSHPQTVDDHVGVAAFEGYRVGDGVRDRRHRCHHLGAEVDRLHIDFEGSRIGPSHDQQVLDEEGELGRLLGDQAGHLMSLFGRETVPFVSQFMGHAVHNPSAACVARGRPLPKTRPSNAPTPLKRAGRATGRSCRPRRRRPWDPPHRPRGARR